MTTLLEVPPDHGSERTQSERKPPGWWILIALALVVLVGVLWLATSTRSADNATTATKDQAVSLAETIERACDVGEIPPQFAAACSQAPQTKQEVQQLGQRGATGAVGAQGVQGEQGIPGTPGAPGATSATGSTGATGSQGLTGPKGDAGDAGSAGTPGSTGSAGLQGPPGPQGERGAQGERGEPGQLPSSYTVQRADGSIETCTFNGSPPPDYTCTITS